MSKQKLEDMWLQVGMADGKLWAIPVMVIAKHRAGFYFKLGRDGYSSIENSLEKDTRPYFEEDHFEIQDWASNNMNWSDVKDHAVELETIKHEIDYEEGWVNGSKSIITQHEVKQNEPTERTEKCGGHSV